MRIYVPDEQGKLVPIGPIPMRVRELAWHKLQLPPTPLPRQSDINHVVCAYLP